MIRTMLIYQSFKFLFYLRQVWPYILSTPHKKDVPPHRRIIGPQLRNRDGAAQGEQPGFTSGTLFCSMVIATTKIHRLNQHQNPLSIDPELGRGGETGCAKLLPLSPTRISFTRKAHLDSSRHAAPRSCSPRSAHRVRDRVPELLTKNYLPGITIYLTAANYLSLEASNSSRRKCRTALVSAPSLLPPTRSLSDM